jgi:hypothetical protein
MRPVWLVVQINFEYSYSLNLDSQFKILVSCPISLQMKLVLQMMTMFAEFNAFTYSPPTIPTEQ